MKYSAAVEQWRGIVEKYFKPEDVDKALYVINGESGGDPQASGDGGSSIGLFQMNTAGGLGTGSSVELLSNPEYNIKLAAQAVYGGSGWKPWGEGNMYKGKVFGALGNKPYEGDSAPVNGRAPVGDEVESSPPEPGTTDYETKANSYWSASQAAYEELANYQSSSKDLIYVDEEEGVVYKYNEETEESVVDVVGTKILIRAITYANLLDELYDGVKRGLITTGAESAAAYVASEKEKAANASDSYDDYVSRIKDLVNLEDVPANRAAQFANTMATVNQSKVPYTISGGMGTTGAAAKTDLNPFIESMRNVIPQQAPAPYNISPEVFDMTKLNTTSISARTPEEILAGVGGSASPGVYGGGRVFGGRWEPKQPNPSAAPGLFDYKTGVPGQTGGSNFGNWLAGINANSKNKFNK